MSDVLSLLIFLPVMGAILVAALPRRWGSVFFPLGCFISAFTFGVSMWLYSEFKPGADEYQFVRNVPWIPSYNVTYYIGVDGLSLMMIVLTTLLSFISIFYSSQTIRERKKEFVVSMLVLETCMIGTFAAVDMFLFYVFWEVTLIPMYILIGVFGGPRRIYATLKFFLYTMVGSVLMLVALLITYWLHHQNAGFYSTAIPDLYLSKIPYSLQLWLFGAFFLSFAIKLPVFPFHTWLPDAHVEAPTAGSVLLAGILLKMGGYGLLRLGIPLFPEAARAYAPILGVLAVIGILYGAYVAMSQQDMKKLVAYSSVSHMGFVLLGLASLTVVGFQGAVFQMLAHAFSTGMLFLLVGMIYERRHTRMMGDFGGLAQVMPRYAFFFFIVTLASIGLPGLSGFVGEFLVLTGSFSASALRYSNWMVGFSILGVILGAVYMLKLYERIFLGSIRFQENKTLPDLKWYEGVSLAIPMVLMVWLGLAPNTVLNYIAPSVQKISSIVQNTSDLASILGGP